MMRGDKDQFRAGCAGAGWSGAGRLSRRLLTGSGTGAFVHGLLAPCSLLRAYTG